MYTGYCGYWIFVYLYPVQMIFWMDMYIHFTSNAEMSRPKQFHVSRPKRNVFFNNDTHASFF